MAGHHPERTRLQRRQQELLGKHQSQWLGPLAELPVDWSWERGLLHAKVSVENLAALGAQGWELVAVLPAAGGEPVCYFKRSAADFRDRVTLEQKRRYYAMLDHALPAESEQ